MAQYAAIEALRNGDGYSVHAGGVQSRRRLIVDTFNSIGLSLLEPEGTLYVFPCIKSTGLTSGILRKTAVCRACRIIPGNAFGDCGEGFIHVPTPIR